MTQDGEAGIRTPDLETVLDLVVDHVKRTTRVALPGRVEAYDESNQTVDVQPLIKETFLDDDGNNVAETMPQIPSVPVMFPRSAGFFVTFPIVKGDFVLLVFNDYAIDEYTAGNGEPADPLNYRMHDASDAVAIPGFNPFPQAIEGVNTTDMVLGKEGGVEIKLKPDGNLSIIPSGSGKVHVGADSGAEPIALALKTDTRIGALETATITMAGIINGNVAIYNALPAHAPAPFVVVVPPVAGASVASAKSKAT